MASSNNRKCLSYNHRAVAQVVEPKPQGAPLGGPGIESLVALMVVTQLVTNTGVQGISRGMWAQRGYPLVPGHLQYKKKNAFHISF